MSGYDGPSLTVVVEDFPPQVSACAIVMANLLSSYSGNVNAVTGYRPGLTFDAAFRVPCRTRHVSLKGLSPRVYSGLRRKFPWVVRAGIQAAIRRSIARLGADVVVGVYPSEHFLVAAFRAARELNRPFYAYMHDLWMENIFKGTSRARFAEKWEPVVLKEAARVLCVTEAMQKHYEGKYRIQTDLLPLSVAEHALLNAPTGLCPPQMPKPTVLFVGGVNHEFNLDALKVLASASELLPKEYELLFCTPTSPAGLSLLGIHSSRLRVEYTPWADVQHLESQAHVLVAPLSHKNCVREEVRVIFSCKILMYLLAGRPIIAFGPEDSCQLLSARKNGWGYVVTEDSPRALAEAIVKLVEDESLAARLVHGALQEARSRTSKPYATRLREWVEADARP